MAPILLVADSHHSSLTYTSLLTHLTSYQQIDVPKSTIGGDNATYGGWAPGSLISTGWSNSDKFRHYGSGQFNLNSDQKGDTILTYCLNADGLPHFLHGFSFAGNWSDAGLNATAYGLSGSALPLPLADQGSVALPLFKNYYYTGVTEAFKSVLVKDYANASNYNGSNTIRATIPLLESSAVSMLDGGAGGGVRLCWMMMLTLMGLSGLMVL
jgi:hypothetical protein